MKSKSNVRMIVGACLGIAVYCVATYVVVEQAGGTKVDPAYSNTPNGVTPGAPDFE